MCTVVGLHLHENKHQSWSEHRLLTHTNQQEEPSGQVEQGRDVTGRFLPFFSINTCTSYPFATSMCCFSDLKKKPYRHGQLPSVARTSTCGLRDPRFNSQSRARISVSRLTPGLIRVQEATSQCAPLTWKFLSPFHSL